MTNEAKSFQDKMKEARPDVYRRQRENAVKRAIVIKLRSLRDSAAKTEEDVAEASGLDLDVVFAMESLAGEEPSIRDINSYVEACGGHANVVIEKDASEGPRKAAV